MVDVLLDVFWVEFIAINLVVFLMFDVELNLIFDFVGTVFLKSFSHLFLLLFNVEEFPKR